MKKNHSLFTSYHYKGQQPGPHLLITAGVHGDEYEPILAATELVSKMEYLLLSGSVTIVPVVNESAFSLGTRCGSDGLDLARTCPGKANGTVTERVAANISELIKGCDYYIDLHTGGTIYNIFPLAGYMLHDEENILKQQQEMAKAFRLPLVWGTDRYAEGRTLSVARDARVPAIYVEYGGGISASKEIADAYYNGCLRVMEYLAMVAGFNVAVTQGLYWVEDYRRNNGHLQSKMPSATDGIFIPAVNPGDIIEKDQLWGEIFQPLESSNTKVMATLDGRVLFTRVASRVKAGDSLGGILPITEPGKLVIHES